jgi:hypothetical protein
MVLVQGVVKGLHLVVALLSPEELQGITWQEIGSK